MAFLEVPWSRVPRHEPPDSLGPYPDARLLDEPWRRVFMWTTALANHVLGQDWLWRSLRPRPAAMPVVTAGFIPDPRAISLRFGLCLRVDGPVDAPAELALDGERFPVVVMPSVARSHQSAGPTHPPTGTAACWARARTPAAIASPLPADGVLTAAHVLMGVTAPTGVYGIRSFGLEAAVRHPDVVAPGAVPLPVSRAIACGSHHEILCRSGPVPVTVLEVFQPTRFVAHLLPHRMVTDVAARPGDSGALVREAATQAASGLYVGELQDSGGAVRGSCQLMAQVCDELDIDILL